MSNDLADLRAVAVELIAEFGRPIVLRRASTLDAVIDKPWRARLGTSDIEVTVPAVIIDSRNFRNQDGEARLKGQVAIIAADALGGVMPELKDRIVDGTRIYVVEDGLEEIKPGISSVIYLVPLRA